MKPNERNMTDPVYEEAIPDLELVRCLLCGREVEMYWFDTHMAEECDGSGYEPL